MKNITYRKPIEGYIRNPLDVGSMRNEPCVCASGKKIKNCCGRLQFVEQERAKVFNEVIAMRVAARITSLPMLEEK